MWQTLGGGERWTHLGDGGFYSHGVDSGHWGVSSLWTPCQDEENNKKNISEWHNSANKLSCRFSKHFLTSVCVCPINTWCKQTTAQSFPSSVSLHSHHRSLETSWIWRPESLSSGLCAYWIGCLGRRKHLTSTRRHKHSSSAVTRRTRPPSRHPWR